MAREKVYNEPSEVTAENGEMILDGPDEVAVADNPWRDRAAASVA